MQQKTLAGETRTDLKKGASRRLRKTGRIPAVIYGHNPPKTVSVDSVEFFKQFRHSSLNSIITLKVGSETYDVLVKDYQEDLLSGDLLHVDFFEIEQGKTLRTQTVIHLTGDAAGVKEGGVLQNPLHELDIECLPKDIPESITIDVSGLEIGDAIHVSDVDAPEGVSILNTPEQVIVQVTHVREEVEEEEEEDVLGLEGEEGEIAEGEEGEAAAEEEGEEE